MLIRKSMCPSVKLAAKASKIRSRATETDLDGCNLFIESHDIILSAMERNSSDDDEEDHQHLIPQNDTRSRHLEDPPSSSSSSSTNGGSSFQIEDILSRRKISLNKRYLLAAVSLTISIGLIFLFTNLRQQFSSFKVDPLSSRVKESELRALYLLRQQQVELLSIWNGTTSANSSFDYPLRRILLFDLSLSNGAELLRRRRRPPSSDPSKRHSQPPPRRSAILLRHKWREFESAFQIEDILSRRKISLNKRYVLAAVAALTIISIGLIFLFTDLRRLNLSSFKLDPLSNRVKESELRALYLLRQQQLQLLSIMNGTTTNANSSALKFAVSKQIALNKEIQEALLSPHKTGNYSEPGSVVVNSYDRCVKVDQKLSDRKTVEWKPRPDKFLFAICLSGQMSNHLICLEKHMFFAALLDRVLVIPSSKFDYQYDRVIDIERINTCLGRNVVVSFDQFKRIVLVLASTVSYVISHRHSFAT
ncbi:hypothetical protein Bca52824_024049 [Brassica carinata]|uniref:Uncharacterized protein n=1 Tax=Brassica carinata TaxID=52824 RepID=A0A8X8AWB9_BRACI|nr:hypothetical protein Bca52824_024049 [Brassica carinata]